MPGTTRYSATFDRTYEEDDRVDPSPPPNTRRSRSLSWQAHSGLDGGRPYTPLGIRPPSQRSSSTDNGPLKVAEHIPTRTVAKTAVKAHNNPFQFVKVGTCPLYKKAEEQLKKTKEVKKQDVLKEEEEEWQSNLDSWKSRRRKMSEDIFRRQEEIKQFELEEQVAQVSQKKTKTFSEMVESRSTRGRALSLCLISSPLDFQDWEFENKSLKNGSCSTFTDESEENSTVNSEDEGVILRGRHLNLNSQNNNNNNRTNGDAHIEQTSSKLETHNGDYSKLNLTPNSVQKPKEGSYIDSGLESISSSHRAGDTPDSGSDFSQDSNSSIDCESPRTGINILEEFNSKSLQVPSGQELTVRLALTDKAQEFGFTLQVDKDAGQVLVTTVLKDSIAESSGVQVGDQIMAIDGIHVSSKQHAEIISMIQKRQEKGEMILLLWRHSKTTNGFNTNGDHVTSPVKQKTESQTAKSEPQQYEKSIESENEMYVDDFEELQRQSELLNSSNKSETSCIKSEAQSNGNLPPTSISSKTESLKTPSAPKQKENTINGADNEMNSDKTSSELNTEIPKKNIIKVKRVRKKGVCGLDVSSTPNQIPQAVPVNSLYPLSPVTELPSPADETKTISSALSSKPSTPVVKSEKSIFPKVALNEAEIKINSSNAKENASPTTVAKSAIFKNAIPTENQKISSLEKVENKTISSNVPASPTNTKFKDINISLESSQDEKSKAPSSPKKVKVKVKKVKETEQISSDLPLISKELPSSSTSVIEVVKDQSKNEKNSVSDHERIKDLNKKENSELSSNGENKAETAPVLPESKSTSKTKASVAKNKNLSLKIIAENKSANLDTSSVVKSNVPKTPQDEKTNSSLASPREKIKLKENDALLTEKITTNTEEINCTGSEITSSTTTVSSDKSRSLSLNSDTQGESVNMLTTCAVIKSKPPKTPQDENSKPFFTQKKEKAKSKDESILSSEKSESRPKCDNLKEKSLVSDVCSPDKTKELPLKIDASKESATLLTSPAVTNSEQPKSPQDEKAKPRLVRKRLKSKGKDTEEGTSNKSQLALEESSTSCHVSSVKNTNIENESSKVQISGSVVNLSPLKVSNESKESLQTKVNNSALTEIPIAPVETKSAISEKNISVSDIASSDETRNLSLKISTPNELVSLNTPPAASPSSQPNTPQGEKPKPRLVRKRSKDSSSGMSTVILDLNSATAKDKISAINTAVAAKTKNLTLNVGAQIPCMNIPATCAVADNQQLKSPSKEKSKTFTQKKENAKLKSTISQKVNSPAKQNEEISNSNIDSLNIVFQSEPKNKLSENQIINSNINENSNKKIEKDLVTDILPVEKVAEEMEKLILEQLEEEERAKELNTETKNTIGTPEHLLIAPPKLAEPPKEKPPPPPSTCEVTPKDPSLKRVNSTKRIKKEIHKRRSNFLGIDNAESNICNEPSIPPPPALEEILKAEMELDRQSRIKIENAAVERLTLEEKEIREKEREIIESLESEERMKQMLNGTDGEVICEENHILSLKNERKNAEHSQTDEQQQLSLLEEKQLREREEFIRKQETAKSARPLSDPSLSVAANASNISQPALSFLTDTKSKVSLSSTNGDGNNISPNPCHMISENNKPECEQKVKASEKPAVPPKPLKKKEAIRKERERLRQEQEALQREREEHRRKLVLEQEELLKHHKSHAPDASVSRLGPLPPLVPSSFPPQLTTPVNATPNARENASFPSRSHHGDPNIAAGSINAAELMGPPVVRQNKMPPPRKAAQNEAWGQQKMPSVKKQNQDSLTESRYNQNHWLIQEAEMRRIAELKERQQRVTQLPSCSQTHLAEDNVCSNPPRVPVITPPHNPHLSYAVQDKMWNYGQPPKKYPPATKDTLHTVYPRETVSQQPPTKPSRVVPMERQEQMLSVSGRKRCSHCNEELGRGAAMIIESLQLYYHIHCFQCCVCQAQLGNGSCGTDVRVRNNKLHCHNCYSNDEAGLKFSQV